MKLGDDVGKTENRVPLVVVAVGHCWKGSLDTFARAEPLVHGSYWIDRLPESRSGTHRTAAVAHPGAGTTVESSWHRRFRLWSVRDGTCLVTVEYFVHLTSFHQMNCGR